MLVAVTGMLCGDIGSGVFAPLDWLSMRRFALDRVLYGNFKKVINFFRSSRRARSWRCAYASLLMSSSEVETGISTVFSGSGSCNEGKMGVFVKIVSCFWIVKKKFESWWVYSNHIWLKTYLFWLLLTSWVRFFIVIIHDTPSEMCRIIIRDFSFNN